jgi:anaerobic ribonucleoside-triphosphate reductase
VNLSETEVKAIMDRILELEKQLKDVKGTECEVYSRVCGFYRPTKAFNEGKQAEFKDRVPYEVV